MVVSLTTKSNQKCPLLQQRRPASIFPFIVYRESLQTRRQIKGKRLSLWVGVLAGLTGGVGRTRDPLFQGREGRGRVGGWPALSPQREGEGSPPGGAFTRVRVNDGLAMTPAPVVATKRSDLRQNNP